MLNVIFEVRLKNIAFATEKDKKFLQVNLICNSRDIYTNFELLINRNKVTSSVITSYKFNKFILSNLYMSIFLNVY